MFAVALWHEDVEIVICLFWYFTEYKVKTYKLNKYLYIIILSILASAEVDAQTTAKASDSQKSTPRLVVNISIDQLRADYLEEFMPKYGADGFRKLLASGIVYENAGVPFLPVDRASASASLTTGAVPFYNGIPSAEWFSRKNNRLMLCTSDQKSLLQPRGSSPSPINMVASTIGDELKIATKNAGKVYGIAPECDAAIMLAGHAADGAVWLDMENGLWTASTFYNKTHPEWIAAYNKIFPAAKKLKSSKYSFAGVTRFADYATSSLVNDDVTDIALQCVQSAQLGADNIPDILSLQYYAGTYQHKSEYETVKEILDAYLQLDATLTKLVRTIESRVGKGNVLFVVSSTGYFEEPTLDYTQYNVPSGTVYINRTASLLNMYLSALYGQAHYVDGYKDNNIYIDHKVVEQKRLKLNDVLGRSREMLLLSDGISNAYTSFDLSLATDTQRRLLHNGFNVNVSGDLVIETAPGWKLLNEDIGKQQKWHQYGFAFPIIVYGADVAHEVVTTPVTIDQIAPTICRSIRIRAPNACKSAPLH